MLAIRSIHKTIAHVWPPTAAAAAVGRPPPSVCVRPLAYRPSPHQLGGGQVVDPFGITKDESDGARAGAAEAAQANSPAHTTCWDEEVSQPARCSRKLNRTLSKHAAGLGGRVECWSHRAPHAPNRSRKPSDASNVLCNRFKGVNASGARRIARRRRIKSPTLGARARSVRPAAITSRLAVSRRRRGREQRDSCPSPQGGVKVFQTEGIERANQLIQAVQ